jgi:hypothetical protein
MTLEGPTAEQLKRMREELQEDPVVLREGLERLRDWLNRQPHLPHHMGESVSSAFTLFSNSLTFK